jgi:hypothetical protein
MRIQQTTKTNFSVIDLCEDYGVRGYIFAPCIVYGQGEGFGKQISIQVVEIVKAARKTRRVYDVNSPDAVCSLRLWKIPISIETCISITIC